MFPDQVQLALHVAAFAGDRNDRVLVRHHDRELAESAVAAKGPVGATPELVAVALQPVILLVGTARFGRQGLLDYCKLI